MIKRNSIILIVVGWIILTLLSYYYIPYFITPFIWIGLIIALFSISLIQFVRLIKARKELNRFRFKNFIVFTLLLVLTVFQNQTFRIIENVDWYLFYNMRSKVVEEVKNNELNPNVEWNDWVCELPFEFPPISNGGNDIGITRYDESNTLTVTFWVDRAYWDDPSTYIIYTNNPETIEILERRTIDNPDKNWRIKKNWYRKGGF